MPDIVFIEKGTDEDGYPIDVLEDVVTGARYKAYTPEDWWAKCERQTRLRSTGQPLRPTSDRSKREVFHVGATRYSGSDRGRR